MNKHQLIETLCNKFDKLTNNSDTVEYVYHMKGYTDAQIITMFIFAINILQSFNISE